MVEITSEEEAHPVECALQLGETPGWRAAEPAPQVIRLLFDQPQKLKRIWLVFEETESQRTQEFVLRVVPGSRAILPRNCSPAMEFQPTRDNTGD
jgi:hypothetical protein